MKCPKCGYLGFETTERCRNCGYDFSLTSPAPSIDLPLRTPAADAPLQELALGGADAGPTGPVDLNDRDASGFGRSGPRPTAASRAPAGDPAPERAAAPPPAVPDATEDLPLFAPRPAGTPLAVRRPGHEAPKARRTTRPVRVEPPGLPLLVEPPAPPSASPEPAPAGRVWRLETAGPGGRLLAASIDLVVLATVDLAAAWLTLRIAGLEATSADLALIRPAPIAAFFLVLAFLYLVGFTLAGGRTIGKMILGLRVIGDDGRGVDITGAVVRAAVSLLSVLTLGILFVPVFVSADRRAVHDRLAGTRVIVG